MKAKGNKIEQELKKLTKLEGNKTCCDCPEKMPSYADLTNCVFLCTKCAGIHREFQFKVKGISMSVFTEEDVAFLASMGNTAFNAKYMAGFNARDNLLPTGNDNVKLKEHIRAKYLEKRFYRDDGSTPANGSLDQHAVAKTSSSGFGSTRSGSITIKPLSKPSVGGGSAKLGALASAAPSGDLDLLSLMDEPTPSAEVIASKSRQSEDPFASSAPPAAQFDAFGSNNSTVPTNSDPFASGGTFTGSSGGFDAFGSSHASSTAPAHSGNDGFDPFSTQSHSTNNQHNSGFDAFGAPPPGQPQHQFGMQQQNQQFAGGFSNFANSTPVQQQQMMPMPFIKLAPPKPVEPDPVLDEAPQPDPEAAKTGVASTQPKNFSAFDDLVVDAVPPVQAQQANPFESAGYNQPQQQYPNQQHHQYNSAPYGVQSAPFGNTAPHPNYGGYGPQPGAPGFAGYPPPYPPAAYGAPPPNYYPQHPNHIPHVPYSHPPSHLQQPPFPQPSGHGTPASVMYGATGAPPTPSGPAPSVASPAAAPAPPPDPFASMASGAWNAVGGSMPTQQSSQAPAVDGISSAPTLPPSAAAAAPSSLSSEPPAPPTSVNPFDMF